MVGVTVENSYAELSLRTRRKDRFRAVLSGQMGSRSTDMNRRIDK